jgi:DNA-binding response OmpR family regulator
VMMPGMDGLAVCEELKQISPALPIILVTAKDDMTTRVAGMALGVSEFVVKPVNHADLLARIQTQLSVRRWEQEADRASAAIAPGKSLATEK